MAGKQAWWSLLLDATVIALLLSRPIQLDLYRSSLSLVDFLTFVLCVVAPLMVSLHYTGLGSVECGSFESTEECDAYNDWLFRARDPSSVAMILQWLVG